MSTEYGARPNSKWKYLKGANLGGTNASEPTSLFAHSTANASSSLTKELPQLRRSLNPTQFYNLDP